MLAPLCVPARSGWRARQASAIALPAALGVTLLPILGPALLDPRWWGAIFPAQLLLLAAMPAAICRLREAVMTAAGERATETRHAALQAMSAAAVAAFAAPYGLGAVAAAV